MKRHVRVAMVAGIAAMLAALLGAGAASAMVVDYSAAQLTDRATTIVIAKALDSDGHWTHPRATSLAAKGTIVTDVALSVYEVLKGEAARTMSITVPGGEAGAYSMPIPDAPVFQRGQTYVVFLDANDQVIAWRVGQPHVVGDRVPALKLSVRQLRQRVAARIGRQAKVLRSWSGSAPAGDTGPAGSTGGGTHASVPASRDAATSQASGSAMATGTGALVAPAGVQFSTPAGSAARTATPRAITTPFSDDFSSGGLAGRWTTYYPVTGSPSHPVNNARLWDADFWLDEGDNLHWWAYSGAQRYEWYGAFGMWYDQMLYGGSYAANDNTWMIGPSFNLSGVPYAVLDFDLWVETADDLDRLWATVSSTSSVPGAGWEGYYFSGREGTWGDPPGFVHFQIDLTRVPYDAAGNTHNHCGKPSVRVAFIFQSDPANTAGRGAAVDNVRLRTSTEPIPVVTAVTPPNAPAGTYLQPERNQSRITISGTGFGAAPGRIDFFYQDGEPLIQADSVASWSDTQIVCDVPVGTVNNYSAAAGSGPVYVTTAGGVQSGGFEITVPFAVKGTEWPASRCFYRTNMGGGEAGLVNAATQTWNNAGAAFQFVNIGTCTTTTIGSGEETQMPLDTFNDMCFGALPWDGVIACAWPIAKNGVIRECDIVFNTNGIAWGDGSGTTMDIQTIALHELGHWLSLRDLYGADSDKVMYGFGASGQAKRSLSAGDLAGIQWIYGDNTVDSRRPTTAAKSSSVRRGRAAKIVFRVADAWPSIGTATLKIFVKNARGRVVKKVAGRINTNEWLAWTFKCKLPRGKYRVYTYATDDMGFKQSRIKVGKLTVK